MAVLTLLIDRLGHEPIEAVRLPGGIWGLASESEENHIGVMPTVLYGVRTDTGFRVDHMAEGSITVSFAIYRALGH